jgi:hypothetical protein
MTERSLSDNILDLAGIVAEVQLLSTVRSVEETRVKIALMSKLLAEIDGDVTALIEDRDDAVLWQAIARAHLDSADDEARANMLTLLVKIKETLFNRAIIAQGIGEDIAGNAWKQAAEIVHFHIRELRGD